jgi:ERO1-like protein alpha
MIRQQRLIQPRWLVAFITALFAISIAIWFPSRKEGTILEEHLPSNNDTIENITINTATTTNDECSCAGNISIDDPLSFASTVGLEGNVSDCCCSFSDMENANSETVYPLLKKIVATPFFSHFKMDLCSICQLWEDAPLCILRDCAVCECEKPPEWAHDVEWMPSMTGPDPNCEHLEDRIVTTIDPLVGEDWMAEPSSFLDQWNQEEDSTATTMQQDDTNDGNSNAVVVDLRLNPERYTGYSGQSAEKVWTAIHADNCFQPPLLLDDSKNIADGYCALTPEQRVYNRILSGLHSSISLHIAHSYCIQVDPERPWECKTWAPNSPLAHERVLDHPDRLENLYVAFATVLRAVQKAGPAVTAAVPHVDGLFSNSLAEWTDSLLPELTKLAQSCPLTFDESSLFPDGIDQETKTKRVELQRRFRHLQQIMECVGCDRCKLWGTLQTLGIGTALRVLLHDDVNEGALNLSRQEAVALVHTLERLSSSLVFARELQGAVLDGTTLMNN